MLTQSSDSYSRWMETLSAGRSPHGNEVIVHVVEAGAEGLAPEGRKSYWTGNVRVDGHRFQIRPGGLVIVNDVDGRYVYYCPTKANPRRRS